MIFYFLIFKWATTPISGDLDLSNTKTATKLFKISQNKPMIVNFLISPGGPWPTPAHERLHH